MNKHDLYHFIVTNTLNTWRYFPEDFLPSKDSTVAQAVRLDHELIPMVQALDWAYENTDKSKFETSYQPLVAEIARDYLCL